MAPRPDKYLTSGNGSTALLVALEHRRDDRTMLVDLVCDGSFADVVTTIRRELGAEWAIADSWEIQDGYEVPEYVPLAA